MPGDIGRVIDRWLSPIFAPAKPSFITRALLFAVWLALVAWLAAHHVMWRDEVRALSLATQGGSLVEMVRAARGYGHPLLWHVLLRLAHDMVATPLVLPAVALAIGVAAAAVLVFSRLSVALVTLVLFSGFGAYAYVVMARNYGIAMLLLLLFAALYPHGRKRGVWLGGLLFLLCNANVHSVVIGGALLLFWLGDLVAGESARWSAAKRHWLVNALLFAAGALLSFVSVFPSVEDAPAAARRGLGETLPHLLPGMEYQRIFGNFNASLTVTLLAAALVAGSVASFARRPAALVAAVAGLAGLQLLFVFVYPGHYRHAALLIMLFVVLHWMTLQGFGGWHDTPVMRRAERIGRLAFLGLLIAQLPATARAVIQAARAQPEGEARALATLLDNHGLQRSIVIADPDFLIETLPYYASNPILSVRGERPASVVPMKLAESAPVTPGRMLDIAGRLATTSRRPVVILLAQSLADVRAVEVIDRGAFGPLVLRPADVARFQAATRHIASLRSASGDERYDVYVFPR